MKAIKHNHRILLVTLLVSAMFSASTLFGQEKNYKPVEVLGKTIVEVNANLGDMVEVVFKIRNNSLDDYHIAQVQTDCHCVEAIFPKLVPRNTIDSIVVVLNTNNIPPGTFNRKAYLETPDDKVVELIIQGNIKVVRPIVKPGTKPIIYKPVHIRLNNSEGPLSEVQWIKTNHDFGYVKAPEPAKTKFRIENLGPKPIEIILVEPGCSCTVSDYTKGEILPGEFGEVTAAFTTKGAFGYFKKFIRVDLNDGRTYQLSITGNVTPE
jgi:hypothetical protein